MWWVGTRKGLFQVIDGEVCRQSFEGVPVTMVLPMGQRIWAALQHGHYGPKLHVSEDGGSTWAEAGAIAYPAVPSGDGPSVHTLWALESGGGDRLWCGTIPGGLFRSDDAGVSWSLVEALEQVPERANWFGGGADEPGIHSICVDPRDRDRVRVAVSCGGVWETRDAGESWSLRATGMRANYMAPERALDPSIQDPHRMVQCASDPNMLWCQHHNGVFRSVDDGATWDELTVPPSSFGFAVAVHPDDPQTAWFVPAANDDMRVPVDGKVVVARTRDGGQSFELLRAGLPQQHAYDLVFRHALAIDSSGDRLAFGSTTGTLWQTDDGGDHWRTVSHHLPPIYVVRPG